MKTSADDRLVLLPGRGILCERCRDRASRFRLCIVCRKPVARCYDHQATQHDGCR